jgi:hypothetical protein
MRILLKHENLNVFRHFGGTYSNENNKTRALMIASTRSPYGLLLLQSLLDRIIRKAADSDSERGRDLGNFLVGWDSIEVAMQRGVGKAHIPPSWATIGILVEIVPARLPQGIPETPLQDEVQGSGGIADAVLRIEKGEGVLGIVIESKLYGPVGERQIAAYLQAMAASLGTRPLRVQLSWDDIDQLIDGLPEGAQHDPILADFADLLREDPYLVAYTGFHERDFGQDTVLDRRLKRVCQRLIAEPPEGLQLSGSPDEQRRARDLDIWVTEPPNLKGNLGIASWEQGKIATKLVVGSSTFWQTSHVLERSGEAAAVREQLMRLSQTGRLGLSVGVRVRFHRFDAPWLRIVDAEPEAGDVARLWPRALEVARRFHGMSSNDDGVLSELQDIRGDEVASVIERIRAAVPPRRPRLFADFVFRLDRKKEDLVGRRAPEQLEMFRQDMGALGRLLQALSA